MASPQCENGYTKIANEIMEQLISQRVPGEQFRVLLCIIRASYGWNEKSVSITHQEIADQTGMARPSVSRAISSLVTKKLLTCNKKVTKNCNELIFNKNHEEWDNKPKRKVGNKKVTKTSNKKVTNNGITPIIFKEKKESKEKRKPKKPSKKFAPLSGDELKIKEPWINIKAWDEWLEFRVGIKKPYKTQIGVTKALNVLRPYDVTTQQQIIDKSISAEYQGLFPPNNNKPETPVKKPREITMEDLKADAR